MSLISRERLLGASAINGGGFLIASTVTIGWWLLVTRLYPPDQSGRLILAISVAGIINLLDFGVSQGLVSLVSAQRALARASLDPRLLFKIASIAIVLLEAAVGAAGLAWWLKSHPADPFLTPSLALLILGFALSTQALQLCIGMLKGLLKFRAANLVSTGSTIVVYGLGAIMVWLGADIRHVLASMAIAQMVTALASVRFAWVESATNASNFAPATDMSVIRTLLHTSLPLYPQMFTGIFFNHIQRFLIARFVGLDAVAVLSLAFSIATRLHAVVNAFLEVLFPMARQMKASGTRLLTFCLRYGAIAALAYAACAAIVTLMAILGMPGLVSPFGLFAAGVTCSVAVAPAFHLLNGTGQSWQVSIASALSPVTYLASALVLHSATRISGSLLLPLCYTCASLVLVIQIFVVLLAIEKRERAAT